MKRTALALLGVLVLGGCSGQESTCEVTGKVTMQDGTPLTGGTVVFQPDTQGKPGAKGQIQSDGTYSMGTYEPEDGVVVGTHRVLVVPQPPQNWDVDKQGVPPDVFDPKYRNMDTSGLTCDVKDDMTYDIKLDPAPPPAPEPKKKPKSKGGIRFR